MSPVGGKADVIASGPELPVLAKSGHLSIVMVCAIYGAITIATHPAVEANVGIPNQSRKEYDSRLGNLS